MAILAGLLNGLLIVVQMALIAWLVQAVILHRAELTTLLWPLLLLLPVLAGRGMTQAWQESAGHRASSHIRAAVRLRLMQRWAALGPVRLAGASPAGLASQAVEQVEALDGYYARFLPQMWVCVLIPLLILGVYFWLDWLAALFLLLSAPLIPMFMALVGMGAEKLNQQHFALVQRLAGHFVDRVRGLTTLRLFGQTREAVRQVAAAADQYRLLNLRTLRLAFLSSAVLEFFASVAIAIIAIYIGFGLLGYIDWGPAPQLTLFSGLFMLLLAPEFFQPLRTLAQHYHDRAAALGAAEHLMPLLLAEDQPQAGSAETTDAALRTDDIRDPTRPAIDIADLRFGHPGRRAVLDRFSLRVRAGEFVALAGPSGSGKSTLLQLIAGFIHPDAGTITVFGDVPGRLRLAWMDQRPCIVQGSWADNLRLTSPEATAEQMQAALARAGLAPLLAAQPDGIDSPVGEGGRGLSGGQSRRLALARVFLSASPLVLLDEPTTGLDADSEAHIIQGLQALVDEGRTLIVATHHPHLLAAAQRIVTPGRTPTPATGGPAADETL